MSSPGLDMKTSALQAVAAAVGRGDLPGAANEANAAIRKGLQHPVFFNARALLFQEQGRHPEALAEYEKALELSPNDVVLLNAIGLSYVRCERFSDGISALDRSLKIMPHAATYFRKGWALAVSGDRQAARAAYQNAADILPTYTDALAALAALDARDGKTRQAREYAERCLAIDPGEPTALSALAMVEIDAGDFAKAEDVLRKALEEPRATGHVKGVLLGYLGDALDGQNKTDEALAAYRAKANEMRNVYAPQMTAMPSQTKILDSLAAYLESIPAADAKRPKPVARAPREHVFLLGFMRSGTTLLEQVLARHPDVVNLEERRSLQEFVTQYLNVPTGMQRLRALDGAALERAREAYWQRVRSFGVEPEGKVFIDKQPLSTINLPLIAEIFPEAKTIFAIRDPRDVVFSCFRRHFEINPTTYEFLDPEIGARLYAAVMRIGALSREKFPLSVHEHRYEDMIADFEGRVRAACAFLNIDYAPAMAEFSKTIAREDIRSPSAAQVSKPLHDSAIGEWRRYGNAMEGTQATLAPWIERFGYSKD